jgi:hypothetical protein
MQRDRVDFKHRKADLPETKTTDASRVEWLCSVHGPAT